ncbi:MAG TPA: GNAT family N-acetyltransferase [Chitinophagaceae bacterium]|jgi:RimJ/RimL family protein N-acetyltransferase
MKVILREWKKSDAENLARIANNRKIWDNVRDQLPHPYTKKDAKKWLAKVKKQERVTTFCIETENKMAGSIGFTVRDDVYRKTAEIGYFIDEQYWGKSIATEAIGQLIDYIQKNFDVVRIYAEVFEYNKASMKVLEKNGFYLECIRKKGAVKNGIIIDDYVWVKLLE